MRIEKNGESIGTLEEWFRLAPPMDREKQWKDDRSAKEVARAWLENPFELPPEISALLSSSGDFEGLKVDLIEPEARLPFDGYNGPRNADLALRAVDLRGPVGVTVEAKADEKFGKTVSEVFADALEVLVENPRSRRLARITELSQSLFRKKLEGHVSIDQLRYQLLTATAGTLAHATNIGSSRAVLIIHEFVTSDTKISNIEQNSTDLTAFVHRISRGTVEKVDPGKLYGPFDLPGDPLFEQVPAFYIGKTVRKIGEPRA